MALTDLGIALRPHAAGPQRRPDTIIELVMGTLPYVPPARLEAGSRTATHLDDVYSLGAALYDLLTGERMIRPADLPEPPPEIAEGARDVWRFRAFWKLPEHPRASARLRGSKSPPALAGGPEAQARAVRDAAEHLRRGVDLLLLKATHELPARHYRSARELAADLDAAADWVERNRQPESADELTLPSFFRAAEADRWWERPNPWGHAGYAALMQRHQSLCRGAAALIKLNDVQSAKAVLESIDPAQRGAWEVGHLQRCADGAEIVLNGHRDTVICASFYGDDARVVTASRDGSVRVWDARTGTEQIKLGSAGWDDEAPAFCCEGSRALTRKAGSDAKIFDLMSGTEISTLQWSRDLGHATFSRRGDRVVARLRGNVASVWDTTNGQRLALLQHYEQSAMDPVMDPSGSLVVTVIDNSRMRVSDAFSGASVAMLRSHADVMTTVSFSPDGTRVVTSCSDGSAHVWDALRGSRLASLLGHTGRVWYAAFDGTGTRVITASADRTARVWDSVTGARLAVFEGHERDVTRASLSADGTRGLTVSNDGTVRVWEVATGDELAILRGHDQSVTWAEFSGSRAQVVTASEDRTARIWNAQSDGRFSPVAKAETKGGVLAWRDCGDSVLICTNDVAVLALHHDGSGELAELRRPSGPAEHAVFSPDGARLLVWLPSACPRVLDVWDRGNDLQIQQPGAIAGIGGFSYDATRVVLGHREYTAHIWDARSGTALSVLAGHRQPLTAAALSPDGDRVATASKDRSARLWDAATGEQLVVFQGHTGEVVSAAFSADGMRLLTASQDGTARVWNVASGEELMVLHGQGSLADAVFSADGTRIATLGANTAPRLWDANTGTELLVLRWFASGARALGFSRDCRRVFALSGAGRLYASESAHSRPTAARDRRPESLALAGYAHTWVMGQRARGLDDAGVARSAAEDPAHTPAHLAAILEFLRANPGR